jgi:hypothetical protein
MRRTSLPAALAIAVIATGALSGCTEKSPADASAQGAPAATVAQENPYEALGKLPDWSGAWEPARMARPAAGATGAASGAPPPPPPQPPKLTPAYAKQYAAYQEKNKTTPGINFVSQVANCLPPGVPGSMNQPYPIEFLFTPGRVTIFIETYSMARRIYTAGNEPKEPDASYQGTSVGRWEGDTLIVETTHILPETSPMSGINGHSDKMKVTERIHLVEPDLLEITTTVEDPEVFLEPHTTTTRYLRHRDWHIMEYVCAQNNRDQLDEKGNPGFNLDRKPGE